MALDPGILLVVGFLLLFAVMAFFTYRRVGRKDESIRAKDVSKKGDGDPNTLSPQNSDPDADPDADQDTGDLEDY